MSAQRYLRKKGSKHIMLYNELLADRGDIFECDANGRAIVSAEDAQQPPATGLTSAPEPKPSTAKPGDAATASDEDSQPSEPINITKDKVDTADRATLVKIAKQLKLDIHPASKDDTFRAKIIEVLFPEG